MNMVVKNESALAVSESELIDVLATSLYPGASIGSIKMVLGYCKASNLDPMQKPVHIVPMWDSKAGSMRDVVMPGIGLYRTQAARNGCAGVTEPEFGPDVTETIGGQSITYPAWCKVTVKRRLQTGELVEFTAKEFWKENYAVRGGKDKSIAPNAMWTKRPYGQLAKCAEGQALRKAFPELGSAPTAEEMEGKQLQPEIEHVDFPTFDLQTALTYVDMANSIENLDAVWSGESSKATAAKDKEGFAKLKAACQNRKKQLQTLIKNVDPVLDDVLKNLIEDVEDILK